MIILLILFGLVEFFFVISNGTLYLITMIAIIGYFIILICTIIPCSKNYIWYNNENSNIEVNCNNNKKKIIVPLNSIERIIMEDSNENSIFYFVTNLNEKIKFLVLPLKKGVPFKEGEDILNDWCNYLKNKKQNTKN